MNQYDTDLWTACNAEWPEELNQVTKYLRVRRLSHVPPPHLAVSDIFLLLSAERRHHSPPRRGGYSRQAMGSLLTDRRRQLLDSQVTAIGSAATQVTRDNPVRRL